MPYDHEVAVMIILLKGGKKTRVLVVSSCGNMPLISDWARSMLPKFIILIVDGVLILWLKALSQVDVLFWSMPRGRRAGYL